MSVLLDQKELFISIVICTLNRRQHLKECLKSIFKIDYPESSYEVIVVDGGSTDGTENIKKDFPRIQLISEPRFGIAYARNKGAEASKGAIVAYTDDDCVVDKLWLRSLVSNFKRSRLIMGVGGPVFPAFTSLPKKILVSPALGLFDEGDTPKFVNGFITSNSAFRKEIFQIISFDEKMGATRRGQSVISGEDVDFCTRIVDLNFKLFYEPSAKVYHKVRLDRVKVPYIIKHAVNNGISVARLFEKKKRSVIWMLRLSLIGLIKSVTLIVKDRSFTVCYEIIVYFSASFVSIAGINQGSIFISKLLTAFQSHISPLKKVNRPFATRNR